MFAYSYPLYRPPSEADNLILQVTEGCSFNGCTFCSMYKEKPFKAKPIEQIMAEIKLAASYEPEARRFFLADGDAMTLASPHLSTILSAINQNFAEVNRIAAYANPINLIKKPIAELKALREQKLSLLYIGIESGSADILRRIRKGTTRPRMIEAIEKAKEAGFKVSATVIFGLGGENLWQEHINETASLVNLAPPNYLSTLQLELAPENITRFLDKFGPEFAPQDDLGMLKEQTQLINLLNPSSPIIFRSNHASNSLALAGNLPKDKEKLLAILENAKAGFLPLRPLWARML